MKASLLLILLFSFASCSLKDAAENNFQTKSNITPFAKTKRLEDLYKKTKIKIPLTESTVGHFDREYVLDNERLDSRKKGFFKKIADKFKYAFYSLVIGTGLYGNRIRYRTFYNFESIDPDLLKNAKITKVFFTTEDCRQEEEYCNGSKRLTSNFNFVRSFFVNVSNYSHADSEGALEFLDADEFQDAARRSYEQRSEDFEDTKNEFNVQNNAVEWDNTFHQAGNNEINLVSFSDRAPELELENIKPLDTSTELRIKLRDNQNSSVVKNYLQDKKFRELIRKVRYKRRGRYMNVYAKKGASAKDILNALKMEQAKNLTSKMVIFRIRSKFRETKRYLDSEKFSHLIIDTTPIGRSLFVELKSKDDRQKLDALLDSDPYYLNDLDIYKREKCVNSNCLDLDVQSVNLVPMLRNNPKFKIDSYIEIDSLSKIDFKYNGYIEIELDLSLPL